MKKIIYQIFKKLGFRLITNKKNSEIQNQINNLKENNEKLKFLLNIDPANQKKLLKNFEYSKSQICQDWFVLDSLGLKEKGYFVEIGAASGVDLSNTYLLEKKFNWSGILCEPLPAWQDSLKRNRNCIIENRCVFIQSNKIIEFFETEEKEFSTIGDFLYEDKHNIRRKKFNKIKKETISLNDLLDFHNAPKEIDYLSIDTEGSEYEILKNFNFKNYSFNVITVEHNNTNRKKLLDDLLLSNGYKKKLDHLSQFESWFTKVN